MPRFEHLEAPIRIGLVSDTHRSSRNIRPLPAALLEGLEGCDLIFHAGDVNAPWVLDSLEQLAPVRAVVGNNDELPLVQALPLELFFKVDDVSIGLMHGHHPRLTARQNTLDRMRGLVDVAVYGHSHVPEIAEYDGLLMVNPGSPTQKRYQPNATFAILSVGDTAHAKLIVVD